MELTEIKRSTYDCIQHKRLVQQYQKDFLDFVIRSLHKDVFARAVNSLLPFDAIINTKLRIIDNRSNVKNIGVCVMRMDIEPALFALGICIDIAKGEQNAELNTIKLITGNKTLDNMREYIGTDRFAQVALEFFEQQIENSFYQKSHQNNNSSVCSDR